MDYPNSNNINTITSVNSNNTNTNINSNNNTNNTNNNTGKISFSADEVSNVYQRWQEIGKQFGQNAESMPEYVQLTQYLRAAARFKQQQQQQQQIPNVQPPQPPQPQQHHQQQQQQQQRPQSTSSIFSELESMLLKAQITAFKSLINNQPIPLEITHFLANNSNIVQQQSPQQPQPPQPQPKRTYQRKKSTQPLRQQQQIPQQVPPQQPLPLHQQQQQQQASMQTPKSRPPSIPVQSAHIPAGVLHAQQPVSSIPRIPQRTPQPPFKINNLEKHFNNVKSVIQIDDPTIQVDSFSVPTPPQKITFEILNNANSRIILPGLFPKPMDIDSAWQNKKLIDNLKIDYTLDNLSKLKDQDLENLIDYQALKLLPLQKAMRGQLITLLRHQNSLLTNTHPNFLAKARAITSNDVLITNQLHEQQMKQAARIEQTKKIEKLNILTESSMKWLESHATRNERFFKLGKSIASLHSATEREELKRIERNAKQRLQALKANDEEAYIKLLDQTKDTRITHLLKQTNSFLGSLAQAVKAQQKDTLERLVQNGHIDEDEEQDAVVAVDDENEENIDYYSVAHRIQETVTEQPKLLIGGTLKEYQIKGLQWMVSLFNNHLNGILADEMGLGKTIQTISLLTYLVEVKKIQGPFLVIVPLSTLTNWNIEFEKWAPSLKKITYKGVPTQRKAMQYDIKSQNFQVLLTTFEYIIKDRPLLSKIKWVHMIIDEGHRMKNSQSKLSSTLTDYYHSDYRLILTGTPLQNNLPELWAILNFVLPKIFNSVKSFDEWFNTPFANTGGQEKIELSEEETLLVIRRLHKVLRPFLLRRLKKDVEKDLPDKVEKVVKCKMSALQEKLYQQMLKYNKLFIGDGDKKAVGVKGLNNQLMQLRKICNHPFVFEDIENMINPLHETNNNIWRVSGKFELLDRVLPKFKATGHRVLIFFQMTQVMDIMEDFLRLRDLKYLRLDGSTKADDRQDMLKVFNAPDSDYFAFLLSTRAGGLGLNLQTADTVIIFDSDWNPHQDLQAQDRAHRIGQKNEVRILRLITESSIEEMILERAHQKLDIDGKVIQAGKFDNKSTAEEQELLLRALIEAEENKKLDSNENDEMNDNELNQVLARSENELIVFKKIDEERGIASMGKSRLFNNSELPDIYNQDPEVVFKEEVDTTIYGRGARERKTTVYDEAMSELQWLKQIQLSSDSGNDVDSGAELDQDDGDYVKVKAKRGRKKKSNQSTPLIDAPLPQRKRKITNAVVDDDDDEIDFVVDDDDDGNNNNNNSTSATTKRLKTAGKRAVKTAKRGPTAGLGRGRSKSATPISRVASTTQVLSADERESLQSTMLEIYNTIHDYEIEGRRLSDIFMSKPARKLYPDYYQLIKYPIAFDVINKRIIKHVYNNLSEFMEDIHLMFINAQTYNQEGSLIYNDAMKLENIAMEKCKELSDEQIDFTEFDAKFGLRDFTSLMASSSTDNNNNNVTNAFVNTPQLITPITTTTTTINTNTNTNTAATATAADATTSEISTLPSSTTLGDSMENNENEVYPHSHSSDAAENASETNFNTEGEQISAETDATSVLIELPKNEQRLVSSKGK